jgi:5-methylcytosine-specific restriction endonuclease McrA
MRYIGTRDLPEHVEVGLLNELIMKDRDRRRMFWKAHMLYLTSKHWRRVREQILKRDGYRCLECKSSKDLHVDHNKYERFFGMECAEDLQTLCVRCHCLKTKKFDIGAWSSKATIVGFNGNMQLFLVLRRDGRHV